MNPQNQQSYSTVLHPNDIKQILAKANISSAQTNSAVNSQWADYDAATGGTGSSTGEPGFGSRVNNDFKEQGDNLLNDNKNTTLLGDKGYGKQNIGTTVAEDATAPLSAVGNVLSEGIKSIGDATHLTKPYNKFINAIANKVTDNPVITDALNKVNSFLDNNPDIAKDINSGITAAGFETGEGATEGATAGAIDTATDAATTVANKASDAITTAQNIPSPLDKLTGKLTPASTQSKFAVDNLGDKDLAHQYVEEGLNSAQSRLKDLNNPGPHAQAGHDEAFNLLENPENPNSIKNQMNTVGATKDATIDAIKDKPVVPGALTEISKSIHEDTEDIDSSDKGNRRLENFKNELHMLASGQKEATVAGGTKIYVPGGKDYVPTVGDVDAFIDKWQKKPKFSDSDAQKAINRALSKVNDHLKTTTDSLDNGTYRKANEDFFKLYDARDKARGYTGNIDPNTGKYEKAANFTKAFLDPNRPLAGLQSVTKSNSSLRAAIADAFESTVGSSDKNNALRNVHASMSPTMFGVRSGLSILMKDLATPESLAKKLHQIIGK